MLDRGSLGVAQTALVTDMSKVVARRDGGLNRQEVGLQPNNRLQRTVLRAATKPERYPKHKMKLYLDDERIPPEGWIQVRWPEDAVEILKTGKVTELSLDHDLGNDSHGTGYDVILWIEKEVVTKGFVPPRITVHSANLSARKKNGGRNQ